MSSLGVAILFYFNFQSTEYILLIEVIYSQQSQDAKRNHPVFALALHLAEDELAALKIQFSINEPVKILAEV